MTIAYTETTARKRSSSVDLREDAKRPKANDADYPSTAAPRPEPIDRTKVPIGIFLSYISENIVCSVLLENESACHWIAASSEA
jgi:hypothetical protein